MFADLIPDGDIRDSSHQIGVSPCDSRPDKDGWLPADSDKNPRVRQWLPTS